MAMKIVKSQIILQDRTHICSICFNVSDEIGSNCNNDIQVKHTNSKHLPIGKPAPPRRLPFSESRSMFPFLRFSAVMASIVVASTAFGFGLAATLLPTTDAGQISNGPQVVSPGSASRGNLETRSIAGYQAVSFKTRSIVVADAFDMVNSPAVNSQGPVPGLEHANMGHRTREIVSACLMAAAY